MNGIRFGTKNEKANAMRGKTGMIPDMEQSLLTVDRR